jgi:hypothetical protein
VWRSDIWILPWARAGETLTSDGDILHFSRNSVHCWRKWTDPLHIAKLSATETSIVPPVFDSEHTHTCGCMPCTKHTGCKHQITCELGALVLLTPLNTKRYWNSDVLLFNAPLFSINRGCDVSCAPGNDTTSTHSLSSSCLFLPHIRFAVFPLRYLSMSHRYIGHKVYDSNTVVICHASSCGYKPN